MVNCYCKINQYEKIFKSATVIVGYHRGIVNANSD